MIKVLVVDDEWAREEVAETLREACEMHSEICDSAEECLKLVQEATAGGRPYDAIVLDIYLEHGRNGDEIIEEILQQCPFTCIVMLTAFSSVATAVNTIRKGAYQYLVKTGFDAKNQLAPVIRAGVAQSRLRQLRNSLLPAELGNLDVYAKCADIVRESIQKSNHFHLAVASIEVGEWQVHYPLEEKDTVQRLAKDHPLVERMIRGETVHARNEIESKQFQPIRQDTKSLLAVPICEVGGAHHGFVELESPSESAFDSHTIDVMKALAEVVAMHHAIKDRDEAREIIHQSQADAKVSEAKAKSFEYAAKECAHYIRNAVHVLRSSYSLLRESIDATDNSSKKERQLTEEVKDFLGNEGKFDEIEDVLMQMNAIGQPIEILPTRSNLFDLIVSRMPSYEILARQLLVELQLDVLDKFQSLELDFDKKAISRALDMIVENAIEASANRTDQSTPSETKISVTVLEGEAHIVVYDTGNGISNENFERLFQPQFSSKEKTPLRGFGLFTAQRIVFKHGGNIIPMNRKNGIGAEFHIVLPIYSSREKAD